MRGMLIDIKSTQEERDFNIALMEQIKEDEKYKYKSPATLKDAIPSFTPTVEATTCEVDEGSEEEVDTSKGDGSVKRVKVVNDMCDYCGRDKMYCQEILFGPQCIQTVLDYIEDCKENERPLDQKDMLGVYYSTYKVLYKSDLLSRFNMYETNYAIEIPECMRTGSLKFCKSEIKQNKKRSHYESLRYSNVEEIVICCEIEEKHINIDSEDV